MKEILITYRTNIITTHNSGKENEVTNCKFIDENKMIIHDDEFIIDIELHKIKHYKLNKLRYKIILKLKYDSFSDIHETLILDDDLILICDNKIYGLMNGLYFDKGINNYLIFSSLNELYEKYEYYEIINEN